MQLYSTMGWTSVLPAYENDSARNICLFPVTFEQVYTDANRYKLAASVSSSPKSENQVIELKVS